MKKGGIPLLVIGIVSFIAGLVLLESNGIGIILMLAGIGCMIFGAVLLMAVSGNIKAHFFDNGQYHASNQASIKYPLEQQDTGKEE